MAFDLKRHYASPGELVGRMSRHTYIPRPVQGLTETVKPADWLKTSSAGCDRVSRHGALSTTPKHVLVNW